MHSAILHCSHERTISQSAISSLFVTVKVERT
jgi:hypothetical protein